MALLKLCQLDRELRKLQARQQAAAADPLHSRQSARRLLLEDLQGSGASSVASVVEGECWIARKRPARPIERADPELPVRAQRLWLLEGEGLRDHLLDSAAPSLGEALAEYVVPRCLPPQGPEKPRAAEETLLVRRCGSRAAGRDDRSSAERRGLLQAIVEANRRIASVAREFAEARRELQDSRDEVEKLLLPELGTGATRILTLPDPATGVTERFYVRVKPARRPSPLQLTGSTYRRLIRRLVEEELRISGLSGARAVDHLCARETGQRLCERLRRVIELALASRKAPAALRISLDHVRSPTESTGPPEHPRPAAFT